MNYQRKYQISLLIFCIFLFQESALAQIPNETNEQKTAVESVQIQENLIHFGDLIDVDVVGSIEYDWRGTLNPEGFLNGLDFVEEPIQALCRNEDEVALDIAKGYAKLLREPKVAVKILDRSSRALSVLQGAVKKSQRFQIKRPVNLNELLILSGGLTERISGEIQIFRPQNLSCVAKMSAATTLRVDDGEKRERFVKASRNDGSETINIRISDLIGGKSEANPLILSGDIITVLEAEPIYIIGGVNSPKQISLRSETTLSRAIASAGGLTKDALADSIIVFRRENLETKIIEASLTKIEAGQTEDIILKRLDIVEVGQKGREKRKVPPIVQISNTNSVNSTNLPLRIIE